MYVYSKNMHCDYEKLEGEKRVERLRERKRGSKVLLNNKNTTIKYT